MKPEEIVWKVCREGADDVLEPSQQPGPEHQHPGQRHDEGGDAPEGDPVALRRADQPPTTRAGQERPPSRKSAIQYDDQHGGQRPGQSAATEPTDRSICPATMTSSMPSAMMMT